MKNIRPKQRFSLLAVVLVAVLVASGFASCSKSETELTPDHSGAINLSANVQATTSTRAAVSGTTFPVNTDNVFRLTAFAGKSAPTTDWSTPYFNDIQVNSGLASALTLATSQYYPANGDKVFFYGYAPAATKLTAGTASAAPIANYTITGQEDIMAAQFTTGIAKGTTSTQSQPDLAFTHKLMQLKFKIVGDASYETGKKVTEIKVTGVKTSAKLDITTGLLTFDATTGDLSLPIVTGTKDEITTAGTEMNGCVMSAPVGTGGSITLKVTAGGVVYDNISVTLTGTSNGEAGISHLVTLTFKYEEIITTAVAEWSDAGTSDNIGELRIGDCLYGGIIYAVEGKKVKVFSLDQGSSLQWSAQDTYVLGAVGQSMTDGKANVAAMKSYATNDSLTFSTAFPAAHFCDNMNRGGVTGWYLPAHKELETLYSVYSANTTAINAGITNDGGTAINSDFFWSSTENDNSTNLALPVLFASSGSNDNSKINKLYVRCVRDI